MSRRPRPVTLTALLLALLLGVVAPVAASPERAPVDPPVPDHAGPGGDDADVLSAEIRRTAHGIPHIVADDYTSLGFGHGYAAAEDNICNLADTLVTGRGERSKYFGPDETYTDHVTLNATNLQTDVLFTNIRDRGVVEDLLADEERGPGDETRAMAEGYVAGVNQYLEDVGGADGIEDPTCQGEDWVRPAEPLDLWYGIYAANLLASTGVFVSEIADADPPTLEDPGLPLGALGINGFASVPDELPTEQELRERLGMGEHGFGSNGTALGGEATDTGRGMVLGNPHFPWRGRYRFSQAHLTIPGEYDVAGGTLLGSPVVNIGWNQDVAWTHTVSTAYRFTPYEYRTLSAEGLPTHYLTTDGGVKELDRQEVSVTVRDEDGELTEVDEDLYRTDEGYVIDAPDMLMGWTPISFFALRDANAEHLKTVDVFHEMAKADDVDELLDAHIETGGMPWVNTLAADRDGNALYADASVVPNVPDELVTRCATPIGQVLFELANLPALDGTRASADCAWQTDEDAPWEGIFGRDNLPHTVRQDWVVNANDSYWLPNPDEPLEGYARIIGCEQCERSLRTRMVYRYVMDRLDGTDEFDDDSGRFSHEQLQAIQHHNRVFGAELAREDDDLQTVCEAAEGGDACDVLADWDGRTDTDSVGAHVFREFWGRTPAERWEEGFDPERPVETPRNLDESNEDVVAAMRSAIDHLDAEGIDLDAELGELQVAGFEHAPEGENAIPIGGGEGGTGNANVVVTRRPAANTDRPYPISYGSSHMQAVSFTEDGVDAATMLTYGLPINDTSGEFSQTRVFSDGEWVDFPWTEEEITGDDEYVSYVVSQGGDDREPPVRSEQPPGRFDLPAPAEDRPGGPSASGDGSGEEVGAAGSATAATPAGTSSAQPAGPGASALVLALVAAVLAGLLLGRPRRGSASG